MTVFDYLRFAGALVLVLGLIYGAGLVLRQMRLPWLPTRQRRQDRRLQVVEILPLDTRYRVVLIQRDETEHLLLLGPDGGRVIEGRIGDTADQGPDQGGNR